MNGYAFPPEPEDDWCEPDYPTGWSDYVGLFVGMFVVIGLILVIVRIAMGFLT